MAKKLSLKEAVLVSLEPIHEAPKPAPKMVQGAPNPNVRGVPGGEKGENIGQGFTAQQTSPKEPQELTQLKNDTNSRLIALMDVAQELRVLVQRGDLNAASQYLSSLTILSGDIGTLIQQMMTAQMNFQQQQQQQVAQSAMPGQQMQNAGGNFSRGNMQREGLNEDHMYEEPGSPEADKEKEMIRKLKMLQRAATEAEYLIVSGDYNKAFSHMSDLLNGSKSVALALKQYLKMMG